MIFALAYGVAPETIDALMQDLETAPVEAKLKPVLAYVRKLTLTPSRMTEADANAVYAAGWSENALFDAIQVCGVFNLANRFVEGTGIKQYHIDPRAVDKAMLDECRSDTSYTDFGRENGLDM
jgi:alkylhydroperoxidase family enzyme